MKVSALGFSRLATALRRQPWPFHTLLIAAYPVLFLYGQNVGELSPSEVVGPLAVVVGVTALLLLAAGLIVGDVRRAALPVSVLAIGLLMYGHIATLLRPLRVLTAIQQGAWVAVVGAALVIGLWVGAAWLRGLTRALNAVASVLVVLALVTILPSELGEFGRSPVSAAPVPSGTTAGDVAAGDREIWYLVFDRYGSRNALQLLHGWDDGPFLDSLRERGFVIAEKSHANYLKTTLSLAATLNLDYFDDLVAAEGADSDDYSPIFERVSDNAVGRFLQDRGYEYDNVGSWYQPTRTSAIADRNILDRGPSDFVATLEDASALPALRRRLGITRSASTERERLYNATRRQLDVLDDLANKPARRFLFAHVLLPHPPHAFAADGSFVPSDKGRTRTEGHNEQITYLHTRMNALIDRLLARPPAERPIIILQADEGPFPPPYQADPNNYDWSTASAEDLEIKYGILNAWYVPDGPPLELPQTISSVNTFRILFNRQFGTDLPILPDRSFTSRAKARPYDLTEITDLLPTLKDDS